MAMRSNIDAEFNELQELWGNLDGADRKLIRGVVYMESRRMLKRLAVILWIAAAVYLVVISKDPAAVTAGIAMGLAGLALFVVDLFKR